MPTKTKTEPIAEGQIPMFPDDAPAFYAPTPEIEAAEAQDEAQYREIAIKAEVEGTNIKVPMVIEQPPAHHLVVGMATLASMSEDEFNAKLAVMKAGQDRIRIIQAELLTKGEDYGIVKGIDRPFLHQPGAEKLANFYGFAVRQEAERIPGDGVATPPLAYHVKSYVHLGDFDGPVIAMGYGEASSWEEKHRYRWAKPSCPTCGRDGLIKGKETGKLKGKWWCPGKEGGCNSTFEAADTRIAPMAKIENNDPYSLAETLIQMAGKRSFVASIRRATGTSGLFTQDEDSPSVREQVAGINQDEPEPVVGQGPAVEVGVGGRTEMASEEQLRRLVGLSKEKDIDKPALVALFKRLFGLTVDETSLAISHAARQLTGDQIGRLLWTMETGEVQDQSIPNGPLNPDGVTTGRVTVDPLEASKASGIILEADGGYV